MTIHNNEIQSVLADNHGQIADRKPPVEYLPTDLVRAYDRETHTWQDVEYQTAYRDYEGDFWMNANDGSEHDKNHFQSEIESYIGKKEEWELEYHQSHDMISGYFDGIDSYYATTQIEDWLEKNNYPISLASDIYNECEHEISSYSEGIVLDHYSPGEIEVQIELGEVLERLEIDDARREMVEEILAKELSSYSTKYGCGYSYTYDEDICGYLYIDESEAEEIVRSSTQLITLALENTPDDCHLTAADSDAAGNCDDVTRSFVEEMHSLGLACGTTYDGSSISFRRLKRIASTLDDDSGWKDYKMEIVKAIEHAEHRHSINMRLGYCDLHENYFLESIEGDE